jgi:DNA polymerase-3 subunit delta'
LLEFVNQTPQLGRAKVVTIVPADALNTASANALLKTLEEPSPNTFLILVAHRAMALPATIRSRCQILHFPVPSVLEAKSWLQTQTPTQDNLDLILNLTRGIPLNSLKYMKENFIELRERMVISWFDFLDKKISIVAVSTLWHTLPLSFVFENWISWVDDMILLKQKFQTIINFDIKEKLQAIAEKSNLQKLFHFRDRLIQAENLMAHQSNLNPQLLLEGLLVEF